MIYLLRHGETVWNRQKRTQGRGDSPLTLRGIEQAQAYGAILRRELAASGEADGVVVHASPLYRAWQTATVVGELLGLDPVDFRRSPLLAEMDCGRWEGMTADEVEASEPGALDDYKVDLWHNAPPGGESRSQVLERARRWLSEDRPERASIVVAHGVVSRAVRGAYLGLDGPEVMDLESHHHGRLFVLAAGRVEAVRIEDD